MYQQIKTVGVIDLGVMGFDNVKRALMTSMLVAAARVAELGEAPATVDLVASEGIKMPQPPLKQIDAAGADWLRQELEKINRILGQIPLEIPAILAQMSVTKKPFYLAPESE